MTLLPGDDRSSLPRRHRSFSPAAATLQLAASDDVAKPDRRRSTAQKLWHRCRGRRQNRRWATAQMRDRIFPEEVDGANM